MFSQYSHTLLARGLILSLATYYDNCFLLLVLNMTFPKFFISSRVKSSRSCTILIPFSNVYNFSVHFLQVFLSQLCLIGHFQISFWFPRDGLEAISALIHLHSVIRLWPLFSKADLKVNFAFLTKRVNCTWELWRNCSHRALLWQCRIYQPVMW